ncbi:MAG: hypothetical protein HW402_919 [Dehalococcoidales bacterium]|nr:hypothetical protein [Dehalococcoidales bacterium]
MTIEEELARLNSKMDENHQQNIGRINRDKYIHLGFILWAFGLATVTYVVVLPTVGDVSMTLIFFILGGVSLFYSKRFKGQ